MPENTRNRSEKKKISNVGPLQPLRSLDWKNFHCFLNLMHELATLWPSLLIFLPPTALTGQALVQSATSTGCPLPLGPTTSRAGAHVAPTGNSGETPATLTEAGVHLTAPDDMGFFHFCVSTWAEMLCPQGKPFPVGSMWYLGKCRCASRTSMGSPLPIPQRSRQRGEAHTVIPLPAALLV